MKRIVNAFVWVFVLAVVTLSLCAAVVGMAQEKTASGPSGFLAKPDEAPQPAVILQAAEAKQWELKYHYREYKAALDKINGLVDVFLLSDEKAKAAVAEREKAAQDTNKILNEMATELKFDPALYKIDLDTAMVVPIPKK